MPCFWPVSILDCSTTFLSPYLLRVSIVWTITDVASHNPLDLSYTVAKFSLVLWTCPAKLILPPLDPSLPACEISSDRPCEEAAFWDRAFPEASRINQDKSSTQLPLTLGFVCLLLQAFSKSVPRKFLYWNGNSTVRSSYSPLQLWSMEDRDYFVHLLPADWEDWLKYSLQGEQGLLRANQLLWFIPFTVDRSGTVRGGYCVQTAFSWA